MSASYARRRELHHRRQRQYHRRRRAAAVAVLGLIAAITLIVTAFGGGSGTLPTVNPPASAAQLLPAGPPQPEAIARIEALPLEIPVNEKRLTAIGYYGSADGALTLAPLGTQVNEGLVSRLWHALVGGGSGSLRWYALPGGEGMSTSALEVGAAAGTDVYAPVSGTIVAIDKVILDGAQHGDAIDIQPTGAPSLVVSVSAVAPDPSLTVGETVTAEASKLGEVLSLSAIETQALARYTNDAGNHVLIEVHPAATLNVP